jgi:Tetratricopeptide repeat
VAITYHPQTLSFRNNLAAAYQGEGDVQTAIPLFEQVLADRQRVLDADDPDTLISRNSIATYLRQLWPVGGVSWAPTTRAPWPRLATLPLTWSV